jgi:hypothetical protein
LGISLIVPVNGMSAQLDRNAAGQNDDRADPNLKWKIEWLPL